MTTAEMANRAARANRAAAYVDAAPVLAKHQAVGRGHGLAVGPYLVCRCDEDSRIRPAGEGDAEARLYAGMAEHQVAALRGEL